MSSIPVVKSQKTIIETPEDRPFEFLKYDLAEPLNGREKSSFTIPFKERGRIPTVLITVICNDDAFDLQYYLKEITSSSFVVNFYNRSKQQRKVSVLYLLHYAD